MTTTHESLLACCLRGGNGKRRKVIGVAKFYMYNSFFSLVRPVSPNGHIYMEIDPVLARTGNNANPGGLTSNPINHGLSRPVNRYIKEACVAASIAASIE